MHTLALLSTFLAAAGLSSAANPQLEGRAACNDDNCARAITGTRSGLLPISSRLADCSSFLRETVAAVTTVTVTTITAASTTVHTTATVTAFANTTVTTSYPANGTVSVTRIPYSFSSAALQKRFTTEVPTPAAVTVTTTSTITTSNAACGTGSAQSPGSNPPGSNPPGVSPPVSPPVSPQPTVTTVLPTSVPDYAQTVCSPASRYSSACSCAGVTGATITQSSTITSTATATVSGAVATVTDTVTTTAISTVYTGGNSPVVTGLPCSAVIIVPYGYQDKFYVACNTTSYRLNQQVGNFTGLSEQQCLDKCAQTSSCTLATWTIASATVCRLYNGDNENFQGYRAINADLLVLQGRGTGIPTTLSSTSTTTSTTISTIISSSTTATTSSSSATFDFPASQISSA